MVHVKQAFELESEQEKGEVMLRFHMIGQQKTERVERTKSHSELVSNVESQAIRSTVWRT